MPVRLTWEETNLNEDGHRIYRSTSPMDPESLPAALATVGANVTQYDDVTAADSTTYYYRVSAYIGSIEQVSDELEITTELFDPATLFGSGTYEGAWFDISDLSTLYQDSSATTPVTTDGDPVGYVADKSGNGHHATQATSGNRPTYRTDGTYHWLEFNHSNNQHLTFSQPFAGTTDRTYVIGMQQNSSNTGQHSSFSLADNATSGSGGDWTPRLETDAAWLRVSGNWSWDYGTAAQTDKTVYCMRWGTSYGAGPSSTETRLNGEALTSDTGVNNSINTDTRTNSAIGRSLRQSPTYFSGDIYQLFIIATLLSDTDRDALELFVSQKTNATLV